MTRRAPFPVGLPVDSRQLVESGRIAYVEAAYRPKRVSRASLEIAHGNHVLEGVGEPAQPTDLLVCLHAPLRARSILEAKAEHGQRLEELGLDPNLGWQVRRAARLAQAGELEREWRASSYDGEWLDLYGVPRRVVFDPRLRDVVAPWVESAAELSSRVFPSAIAPTEGGARSLEDRIVALVGRDRLVLGLGGAGEAIWRCLEAAGCQVVVADPERTAEWAATTFGDGDGTAASGARRFDVALAPDILGRSSKPEALLERIRGSLAPDGLLVATFTNAAHASVRLSLLQGRFPADSPLLAGQLRLFTRSSLESLLERAGFAVGRLEREEAPVSAEPGASLPTAALVSLLADPEAGTARYLVVAYPLLRPELALVQERMRCLVAELDAARRERAELLLTIHEQQASHVKHKKQAAEELRAALAERGRATAELQARSEGRDQVIAYLRGRLEALESELTSARASATQARPER